MKRAILAGLVLGLAASGCEKKEEAATSTTSAAPTSSAVDTAGTEQPSAAADDDSEIPTEQDFEDEAEQQITASNLETELDNLEKEIGE